MLEVVEKDGTWTCRFSGSFDMGACWHVQKQLEEKLPAETARVVFDLAEVSYVCSSFIRLCTSVYKRVGGANFSVTNMSPPVQRVFEIAGLDFAE